MAIFTYICANVREKPNTMLKTEDTRDITEQIAKYVIKAQKENYESEVQKRYFYF